MPSFYVDIGVQLLDPFGRGIYFSPAAISGTEKYRAAQVAVFNGVEVGDDDVANAH